MKGLISKPDNVLSQLVIYIRLASRNIGQESPPINKLTIGMIPCLKTKGAESRRLLPCVVWLLENIYAQDTEHQRLRYQCLKNLSDMYEESRKADFSPKDLASYGRKHLILYCELGLEQLRERSHLGLGWVLYRFYPKHHLALHAIEDQVAVSGNPRESWCYMDENAIGNAVEVAESMHRLALHKSVMAKHRCYLNNIEIIS